MTSNRLSESGTRFILAALTAWLWIHPGAAQELFFADPGGAESLDGANSLVWSTDDCAAGEFRICKLRATWSNAELGATPLQIFDNSGGSDTLNLASNVTTIGSYAYHLNGDGEVIRTHTRSLSGVGEVFASMETPGLTGEIQAGSRYLYWAENDVDSGRLFRMPLAGGPREFVYDSSDGPIRDLQVDLFQRAYFLADISAIACCLSALHQLAPVDGGFDLTVAARSNITGYALTLDQVFVASRLNTNSSLQLVRGPLDDLQTASLWTVLYTAADTDSPSIAHLLVDDAQLFWHERRIGSSAPLLRMSTGGGSPTPISAPIVEARDLTVGGDYRGRFLYWIDGGSIYRLATQASAFSRDLAADAVRLEVVQSIQNGAHSIPLVETKRTYVRAYAHIRESSAGAPRLNLAMPMHLEGRRGGVPLEGSPLWPVDPSQPVEPGALDRTRPERQFLFELPQSWTEGTIELTAVVDPRDQDFETNESNNRSTRTVSFDAVGGICIDIIPVLTPTGIAKGGPLDLRSRTFARARTLLPTDDLVWIFRGGSPKSKPWTGEPYNFNEGDDVNELMFHWWHDFLFAGRPSQCGNRRTIRTAVVGQAARFGMSSGAASIIFYLQPNVEPWEPVENRPRGGVMGLAHEVGHQLGQGHIGCPLGGDDPPANPDGSYPYDPCTLDNSNDHMGFDVISQTLLRPFNDAGMSQYRDFMSYEEWYWVSDYVYLNHHAVLAAAPPSPRAAEGNAAMLVAGYVRDDGSVQIAPSWSLDSARAAQAGDLLTISSFPSQDLRVRVFDVNGQMQVDEWLRIAPNLPEIVGDPAWTSFYGLVESRPDYKRIEIQNANGQLLAMGEHGDAMPFVQFLEPLPGSALGDETQLRWQGGDADGDTLTYRLFYSADGGAEWVDLLTTRDTEALVDLTSLPTGNNVVFQVLASDGLRTVGDQTGPFVRPNRPPDVAILGADGGEIGTQLLLPAQAPVQLSALALDSRDGVLGPDRILWTLSGPVSISRPGKLLDLRDLPPGSYQLELLAIDTEQAAGSATTTLVIEPRTVPLSDPPALDGRCDDPVWAADRQRGVMRYDWGDLASILLLRSSAGVHVCIAGLIRLQGDDFIELRIDPDGDGTNPMQPDDLLIRLGFDGEVRTGFGDGQGGVGFDEFTRNVQATPNWGTATWQAELLIDPTLLGPTARLSVAHEFFGERIAWPAGSAADEPGSWASLDIATPIFSDGFEAPVSRAR